MRFASSRILENINILIIVFLVGVPSAGARELDLGAAVRLAIQQNRLLEADARRLETALGHRAEARGGLLPRVDLDVAASHSDAPIDVFGARLQQGRLGPADFSPAVINDPKGISNYQTRLQLAWSLYAGGRLRAEKAIAARQAVGASLAHDWLGQQVLYETIRLYAAVLDADAQLAAEDKAVEAAEGHLANVRALVHSGMAIDSDVLAAEVHVLKRRIRRDQVRDRLAQGRDDLRRHLGLDVDEPLELKDEIQVANARVESSDLAALIETALTSRADLKALESALSAAEKGVHKARAGFLPRVDLVASRAWNERALAIDNGNTTVALRMGVNLFAGGSDEARLSQARAELERQRLELADRRRQVVNEVRRVWRQRAESRRRHEAEQRAFKEAEEALRIVGLRHRQGLEKTVDLLTAQGRLDEARAGLIDAGFDVDLAQARLLLVTGQLNEESVR